jgi:hypothetical protein
MDLAGSHLSRRKALRMLGFAAGSASLMLAGSSNPLLVPSAGASGWCECVFYVQRAWKITEDPPDAKEWVNGYLDRNGFQKVTVPKKWDIAVFTSAFGASIESPGHVALIADWTTVTNGWKLTIRGAHQGENADGSANYYYEWDETGPGCGNVSDWPMQTTALKSEAEKKIADNPTVSFWTPKVPKW